MKFTPERSASRKDAASNRDSGANDFAIRLPSNDTFAPLHMSRPTCSIRQLVRWMPVRSQEVRTASERSHVSKRQFFRLHSTALQCVRLAWLAWLATNEHCVSTVRSSAAPERLEPSKLTIVSCELRKLQPERSRPDRSTI